MADVLYITTSILSMNRNQKYVIITQNVAHSVIRRLVLVLMFVMLSVVQILN